MPKKLVVPVLQVLFEPFPNPTSEGYTWNRDGGEAFAGTYWLDALEADGTFKRFGYRAMFEGCSGCRRSDADPRAHWDMRNDNPGAFAPKSPRRCGKWRMIESVVKAFGGWKKAHYVELESYEGLRWQSLQGRARNCTDCGSTRQHAIGWEPLCDTCRGFYVAAIGPKRDDRWSMSPEQKRIRV